MKDQIGKKKKWGFRVGRCVVALAFAAGLCIAPPSYAQPTTSVNPRVLVIATGTATEDIGLDYIDDFLDARGVPYDVLDSSRDTLTAAFLSSGHTGFYNGIILTNTDLYLPSGGSGFTAAEWNALHTYERTFSVREAVLSGWPGIYPDLGLDYGMAGGVGGTGFDGLWVPPAGATFFADINTANPMIITDWAIAAIPRHDGTGPQVTPLLVDNANPSRTLIALLTYADGREVLFSTITNAWFLTYSQAFANEFIDFATRGAFLSPSLSLDLRVLVISTGTPAEDLGLDYIDDVLDEIGVPYDVLDSSRDTLTAAQLASGHTGFYNGIILTSTDLYLTGGGSGFTAAEWNALHTYERTFSVREAVLSGWPGIYPDLGLDYGMAGGIGGLAFDGLWVGPAGGTEIFEYINTANLLPITDWAIAAIPRHDGTGPQVTPLLVDNANPSRTLIALLTYADGREVLLSTITNAHYLLHSQAIAYEFINFATRGVFLGGRQVHLTAHLDDLFLDNELWNPATNVTDPALTYRLTGQDIIDAVAMQNAFRAAHSTIGNDFKLDFPFNGFGAQIGEDLTDTVISHMDQFRFINHTFTHADMDTPHPEYSSCDYDTLTFTQIRQEIAHNRTVWAQLGLPEQVENNRVLLTGNHSGLKDRNCTDFGEDAQVDDIHYDVGANPAFLLAAESQNVKYLASDASQLNQDAEQYIPGYDLLLLPRYPTNIFVNAVTPAELTDAYNYVFYERFINKGQNPCQIPGAICSPRTYNEILAAEADMAVRHMLTYRKWPHFFHQSNLGNYGGSSLMIDWLEAIVSKYEELFTLPIVNLPYYQIGDMTRDKLAARAASIQARWDLATNTVTIEADTALNNVMITGLENGVTYGGQSIRTLNLSPTPQTIAVDLALNR